MDNEKAKLIEDVNTLATTVAALAQRVDALEKITAPAPAPVPVPAATKTKPPPKKWEWKKKQQPARK